MTVAMTAGTGPNTSAETLSRMVRVSKNAPLAKRKGMDMIVSPIRAIRTPLRYGETLA